MREADTGFLVEEFLEAITAQLDRTQDALAVKAVNRPLTYAIREFSLDLKVFVEMDKDGQIRFRTAAPNEAGASTVRMEFTTVTRPMIAENSVSLEAAESPTLEEIGLSEPQRRRFERLGVRNAAELERLQSSAGESGVTRIAGVSHEQIRDALTRAQPALGAVGPIARPPDGHTGTTPRPPAKSEEPTRPSTPAPRGGVARPRFDAHPPSSGDGGQRPILRLAPDDQRLRLDLRGTLQPPQVRLNQQSLALTRYDDDTIEVALPPHPQSGELEIMLGDAVHRYDVHVAPQSQQARPRDGSTARAGGKATEAAVLAGVSSLGPGATAGDPWASSEGRRR